MLGAATMPRAGRSPGGVNPYWFGRGCVLGAIEGVSIGFGLLLALSGVDRDGWPVLLGAMVLSIPVGAIAGVLDAMVAMLAVALIGSRGRARRWPASVVAGPAAAAIPLIVTFHAGWPRAEHGSWIGLGLSGAALVAAAASAPIALRPARRHRGGYPGGGSG